MAASRLLAALCANHGRGRPCRTTSSSRGPATPLPTANDERSMAAFMRRIRYSKYVPDPAGEMSLEDLLSALSDYLLQSGFQNYMFYEMPEGDQSLDALRQAIEQALMDSDLFDEQLRERLQQMQLEGTLDELIEKLIERMYQEDFISIETPPDSSQPSAAGGQVGEGQQARFEITDKSLDFLGYKALRDLLGSLGRSSFGRHPARRPAAPAQHRVLRPAGSSVRVPVFLRHRGHAGLLAFHDPLWRGPVHACQESRHGAVATHPHPVPGRLAVAGAVSRFCRGSAPQPTGPR